MVVRGGNSDLGLLDEVATHGVSASILSCDLRLQAYRAPVVNHGCCGRHGALIEFGQPQISAHACQTLQAKNKILERFRTNSSDKSRWTIRYLVKLLVNGGITPLLDEPQLKCKSARDIALI